MVWNSISGEERLRLWKKLRNDIVSLPFEDQLAEVSKFCATMPHGSRSIDYYSPEGWPTPWEIMFHGQFCVSSISLIIFHTLTMLNNEGHTIELHLVKDNSRDYLLVVVDSQYVLNYEKNVVSKHSEIKDYFIVMQVFSEEQVKTIT